MTNRLISVLTIAFSLFGSSLAHADMRDGTDYYHNQQYHPAYNGSYNSNRYNQPSPYYGGQQYAQQAVVAYQVAEGMELHQKNDSILHPGTVDITPTEKTIMQKACLLLPNGQYACNADMVPHVVIVGTATIDTIKTPGSISTDGRVYQATSQPATVERAQPPVNANGCSADRAIFLLGECFDR
jgi:hypothetical protein